MDLADFRTGVGDALPMLFGVVPFAVVAGVAAVEAGLTVGQAVGASVFVFAGASQLAAFDLLGRDAPLAVVVATATVINLRMAMYSASIAPYLREYSLRFRALLSAVLTDMVYARSLAVFADADRDVSRGWYYLGLAAPIWATWQVCTVVGAVLGGVVPASWGLGFAVPLVFLALLAPAVESRPAALAAAVGGGVAVAGAGWPLNLGLLVGAGAGVLAGALAEGRWTR